ncbi:unnamed protein product [Fusarium graminearum]|nr:unnamed protein product [Fusarium graminearum]VTO87822.1 unnamed protein product [Fusarium graminearum]
MCFYTTNGSQKVSVSFSLATGPIPVRVAKESDVFNASPTATLTNEDRPGSPQGLPKHGETATLTARWRRLRSSKCIYDSRRGAGTDSNIRNLEMGLGRTSAGKPDYLPGYVLALAMFWLWL